jgi:hypothetical protein
MASKFICTKCNIEKEEIYFPKDKQKSSGYCPSCKECKHKYYLLNKSSIDNKTKEHYYNNREKYIELAKQNYQIKKEQIYNFNKIKYNKDILKNRQKSLNYYYNNKLKKQEYCKKYNKERELKDIDFKLSRRLRTRLYVAIKNNYKKGSAINDLGCSISYFKDYLKTKFTSEMNWNNYGTYWVIDHIIPLSLYNLSNRNCFLKAVNYNNLQPLEKIKNIRKGNKIEF